MAQGVEIRTYTLGRPPKTTGIGGMSMKVTGLVFGTFMVMVAAVFFNQWLMALVVLAIGGVLTSGVYLEVRGRSIASWMQLLVQQRTRNRRGEHVYVSGPDSKIPGGRFQLPGALARTELVESTDSTGASYGLVLDRANNRATVLLSAQLTGDVDRTTAERDQQTADWGRFEAGLSLAGNVHSCVVVLAHRPSTGHLAEQEVTNHLDPHAPELARRIQQESAAQLSAGGGEIECHIAITYTVERRSARDESFISNLDYLVPNLAPQLSWAGIEAHLMSYEDVVARMHSFVDPSTESLFEKARVDGRGHGLNWEDSGPSWAVAGKNAYAHENVSSVTWEMEHAPASTFEDSVLRPLAQTNVHIPRGRMAMIYEPIPASAGMTMVEREHKDALVGMNSSQSITKIGATVRAEETEQSRRAVARGAQMGLRSMMFTATLAPGDQAGRVTSAVEQAAAQSSIGLRPYQGMHDVGFAITAGMGQTPTTQDTTTPLLR